MTLYQISCKKLLVLQDNYLNLERNICHAMYKCRFSFDILLFICKQITPKKGTTTAASFTHDRYSSSLQQQHRLFPLIRFSKQAADTCSIIHLDLYRSNDFLTTIKFLSNHCLKYLAFKSARMLMECLWAPNAASFTYHKHDVMRGVASETSDGRSQILLMSGQINEGDQLGRILANFFRRVALGVIDRNALRIKTV